ncbi:hypothetical protein J6590_086199 [Homalodisca vitripennis]|nr:hypothetical protein J6590_086199 [Homalodisca vitripennis]
MLSVYGKRVLTKGNGLRRSQVFQWFQQEVTQLLATYLYLYLRLDCVTSAVHMYPFTMGELV